MRRDDAEDDAIVGVDEGVALGEGAASGASAALSSMWLRARSSAVAKRS